MIAEHDAKTKAMTISDVTFLQADLLAKGLDLLIKYYDECIKVNHKADEAAFARPVATAARDDIRAAIAALLKDC